MTFKQQTVIQMCYSLINKCVGRLDEDSERIKGDARG